MSDSILIDTSLRLISSALDEYTDWYSLAMKHFFFHEYVSDLPHPEQPKSISGLHELLKTQPDLQLGDIDRVFKSAVSLQTILSQILSLPQGETTVPYVQFSDFALIYDDMMHRLHQIEQSRYLEGFGYDNVTGLRNQSVLFQDLDREMERVARRGRSFCLALGRIDSAIALREKLDTQYPVLEKHVGNAILATIRSFDDAYHIEEDEFVMNLKHADLQGAQRFVTRLREHLGNEPLLIDGQEIMFTLSFCVAEPVDGEDMRQFLDMMRGDLGLRAEATSEAIVYHEEESPIRRFLREQKQI